MAVDFIVVDRDTPQLLPASVQDYLPERHLARFVVEIVDQLDLHHLSAAYRGTGSAPYPPSMLVALLFYGYATGVFSSRKLAQATYDSMAFMYLSAGTHPDHRTIADFRKRFLGELEALFVEILLVGQALGLVKLGTVSLDGTKIKANASQHKAMSWEYANRLEEQLKGEVHALMRRAEQADGQQRPEPLDIPAELARREQRLAVIAAAKQEIARRAQERFAREQAEYTQKLEQRASKRLASNRAANRRRRPHPSPSPRIRSISRTPNRASCPPPAGASSRPTMRRLASTSTPT
jgi:transposase